MSAISAKDNSTADCTARRAFKKDNDELTFRHDSKVRLHSALIRYWRYVPRSSGRAHFAASLARNALHLGDRQARSEVDGPHSRHRIRGGRQKRLDRFDASAANCISWTPLRRLDAYAARAPCESPIDVYPGTNSSRF